jgi:hypothetical protein
MVGGVCAIVNTVNGKRLLLSATEVARLHNLFDFSMGTGQFSYMELHADAKVFGMAAFRFEVLELLEKEELQSLEQFAEDIAVLCDIWKTKFEPGQLY